MSQVELVQPLQGAAHLKCNQQCAVGKSAHYVVEKDVTELGAGEFSAGQRQNLLVYNLPVLDILRAQLSFIKIRKLNTMEIF